ERVGALVLLGLRPLGRLGLGLVVAEDVARLDLPFAEPLRQRHHVLEGEIEREHTLPHLALAGLDLLGNRHLLLTREEGAAAHLLEIHANRIGRLTGRPFRLLRLGLLLGPFGLAALLCLLPPPSVL